MDVTEKPGVEWVNKTLDQGMDALRTDLCQSRTVFAGLVTDFSKSSACQEVRVDTDPVLIDPAAGGNQSKYDRLAKEAWEGRVDKDGQIISPGLRQMLADLMQCGIYGPGADGSGEPVKLVGSDIFTAVQSAAEALTAIAGDRTVVFLSDMRNTMKPLKMPFKGSAEAKLAKLDSDGIIPDLAGARVVVVGPGTSSELTPAEQAQLVHFWQIFFAAANAGRVDIRQTIG
ncbi:MAG: hypothetical protein ACOYEV_00980 [Candidatus Nanopelagicales bacterium]